MRIAAAGLAAALAWTCAPTAAQQPNAPLPPKSPAQPRAPVQPKAPAQPKPDAPAANEARDLFKGKVKPGLYEVRNDIDLTGVPGIPKDSQRGSETRQRCITTEEIARGISGGEDCPISGYKATASAATFRMHCKDGNVTEMKFGFTPAGFSSEMKTTGKDRGNTFVSYLRSQAKRIGACPK